jgi:hypothetical protein
MLKQSLSGSSLTTSFLILVEPSVLRDWDVGVLLRIAREQQGWTPVEGRRLGVQPRYIPYVRGFFFIKKSTVRSYSTHKQMVFFVVGLRPPLTSLQQWVRSSLWLRKMSYSLVIRRKGARSLFGLSGVKYCVIVSPLRCS